VEKHYTLSRKLPGPDHGFAIEPDELKEMVEAIRAVELACGTGKKDIHKDEEELRGFARRALFTTTSVAAGAIFTRKNIDVLRKGKLKGGLGPESLEDVLGSKSRFDLDAEHPLEPSDIIGWS
jgi:N-acetylneuraminate synthase